MHDPAHPGESLRDVMLAEGWTVTETAAKLGCTRQTFSRLLNGSPRHLAGDGPGIGAYRVEQRGVLDAPAGAVRPGAGAPVAAWHRDRSYPKTTLILSPAQAVATRGSQQRLRVARTSPLVAPRTRQPRYS